MKFELENNVQFTELSAGLENFFLHNLQTSKRLNKNHLEKYCATPIKDFAKAFDKVCHKERKVGY